MPINPNFVSWLFTNFPQFVADFVVMIDQFIQQWDGEIVIPKTSSIGPRDWLHDKGDGTYKITTSGISQNQLEAIRQGIADGIINEKAEEFVKGFIVALQIASSGA